MLGGTITALMVRQNEKYLNRIGPHSSPALYDFGHNILPNLSTHERLIDLCPILLGLMVLYLIAFDNIDGDALIKTMCLGFILRIVTTRATHLPSPICRGQTFTPNAIGGCFDCIFSGHTFTTLLFANVIANARPCYAKLMVAYSILSSVFIIASRSHYTIDVLVAWVVYDWLRRITVVPWRHEM